MDTLKFKILENTRILYVTSCSGILQIGCAYRWGVYNDTLWQRIQSS